MTVEFDNEECFTPGDPRSIERAEKIRRRDILLRGLGLSTAALAGNALLTACSNNSTSTGPNTSAVNTSNQVYVEVSALSSLPYFIAHREGMTLAGRDLNVKTEYLGPSTLDLNAMINTIEQQIVRKVSGLLVVGFDESLKPSINKAIAAGIPTVTLDADIADSNRYTFLGTGNFNVGVLGAKTLAQAIGGQGKVAIVTRIGQSNLEERVAGYKSGLAAYPGIQLVAVVNDNSDSNQAASAVGTLIRQHPDLAGVACVEAAGGVGAATAVKEAGKVGQIKIVSMDRDNGTLDFIKQGVIYASTAQKTALMSYLGTLLLFYYNNHPVAISDNDKQAGIVALPSSVDTGSLIINQANADLFYVKS
jgi:ribose transport system substrate-binding protein